MKKTWIGTSWKMNKTLAEANEYAQGILKFIKTSETPSLQLFLVPPFTALASVASVLADSPVLVGAQNMHWEGKGAFTGEISPMMIKDCGGTLVELGHSERRASFGETDYTVNQKVLSALEYGLLPLICIGETAREKAYHVAKETILRQVKIALHQVPQSQASSLVLAYEPVWAIGEQGEPASPEYANAIHAVIKQTVAERFGEQVASEIPVLYGGSVNPQNFSVLLQEPFIDGLFIGRSAWALDSFLSMIHQWESTLA